MVFYNCNVVIIYIDAKWICRSLSNFSLLLCLLIGYNVHFITLEEFKMYENVNWVGLIPYTIYSIDQIRSEIINTSRTIYI